MSREINICQRVRNSLRRHAHQILGAGYSMLMPSTYATWKEPDITTVLCLKMSEFMASSEAPSWITHYALRDDPKLNVPGKFGESRPRIDIELERVQRGERPLFRFEAKRLGGPDHPLRKYLGSDGLGAFLSGYYPLTHGEAGMLGYVQQEELNHWQMELAKAIGGDTELRTRSAAMQEEILAAGIQTWKSEHHREDATPVDIWHTLLRFW